MAALISAWRANNLSQGSNNAMGFAGLKKVIDRMHAEAPFTEDSVFVDFGSGCGVPCIYVSLRFGCQCFGVEFDRDLVELSFKYLDKYNPGGRCYFLAQDFMKLSKDFL